MGLLCFFPAVRHCNRYELANNNDNPSGSDFGFRDLKRLSFAGSARKAAGADGHSAAADFRCGWMICIKQPEGQDRTNGFVRKKEGFLFLERPRK